MMRKLVLALVVGAVAAIAVTTAILIAEEPTATAEAVPDLPRQAADVTWTPEWMGASDSRGVAVGIARTADVLGDNAPYPIPVYDANDTTVQIGWIGEHGYWVIGQPKAWCVGCIGGTEEIGGDGSIYRVTDVFNANRTITRTTENIDPDGNVTTTVETIQEGE